jgi:hypothetical protein
LQLPKDTEAPAIVFGVDKEAIQAHRRERLRALLAEFGGNQTELGRALGWKSGAYVGHMLKDPPLRPITEDLVTKAHAIPGGKYKGWFDPLGEPATAPQPVGPGLPLPAWLVARLQGLDAFEAGAFTQHALQFFRDQDALRLGEPKTATNPPPAAANQRP